MTVREIDEALERWNTRLAAAAQNLVDLQSLPAYERLAGTNGVGDVGREIAYLRSQGGFPSIQLVPGTEPFKANLVEAILGA